MLHLVILFMCCVSCSREPESHPVASFLASSSLLRAELFWMCVWPSLCLAHKQHSVLSIVMMVIAGASSLEGWRSTGTTCLWWGLSLAGRHSDNQRFIVRALGADMVNPETRRWVRRPCPQTLWFNRDKVHGNPGNSWCGEYTLLISGWVGKQLQTGRSVRAHVECRGVRFALGQLCQWKRCCPRSQTKP